MGRLVNKRELADLIEGVATERTLTEWQKEGMPVAVSAEIRGQENQYDVAAVMRWWCQRELAKAQVTNPREDLDRVRTQREQLALARDLGEVVSKKALRPALAQYVDDVIAILEGIPDKYVPLLQQLPAADGKHQLLREMVREIREGLGSYEFSAELSAGGDTAVPPAA